MTTAKAGKLLAKALNNTSREESLTAFGMAFTYAQRGGFALSSLHRIEIVETQNAGISSERETELVEKYNRTLKRAKELASELEKKQAIHDGMLKVAQDYRKWFEQGQAENKALATRLEEVTKSAQAALELNVQLSADFEALQTLKGDARYYEEQLLICREEARRVKYGADKEHFSVMKKLNAEREDNRGIRIKNQALARDLDVKTREAIRLSGELDSERSRHAQTVKDLHRSRQRELDQIEAHANQLNAAQQQIEALKRELAEANAPGFFKTLFN